jgi:hypothetical protein
MAVPSSGVLDWYSLAQECYLGTYGSGTITGCMAIKEMVIGGQPCSQAHTYPAVSGNSPPPDSSTPYAADEFYGYDKDFVPRVAKSVYLTSVPKPVFACSQTTNGTWYFPDATPAVNDQVYTASTGSATPSAGNYGYDDNGVGGTDYRFTVNASGVITAVASCSPSDRRLKKNIRLIGYSTTGLKIYTFEYLDKVFGEGVFQGVMSDEIPSYAVIKNGVGEYDGVDYSKIDVDFKRIYFA